MFGTYCRLGVSVWSTDQQVIRAARQLLSTTARRRRDLRAERHAFYRQMLDFHHGQQGALSRISAVISTAGRAVADLSAASSVMTADSRGSS